MGVKILRGDARKVLSKLADKSVQCAVTSPPYYGLRDYGVAGQIGLEQSPHAYVAEMVGVFREVWRVLRDDGTCWLNLGDCYASSTKGTGGTGKTGLQNDGRREAVRIAGGDRANARAMMSPRHFDMGDAKPKDLLGMPWRVAFALQSDGWYLRSAIIWHKPNPMPESCRDRPTCAHEMVFLLAKSPRYFYDAKAISEPMSDASVSRYAYGFGGKKNEALRAHDKPTAIVGCREITKSRNARNVWTIAPKPFKDSHFAVMPPDLAERCIKAGTSERGCCPHCSAPWTRVQTVAEDSRAPRPYSASEQKHGQIKATNVNPKVARAGGGSSLPCKERTTVGWAASCLCPPHEPVPCVVLDPFGGAGTTGLVATRLGRAAILCELNPKYAEMAGRRIANDPGARAAQTAA